MVGNLIRPFNYIFCWFGQYVFTLSQSVMIFSNDKVFCPPSLKVGAFTTAAIDIIDHNPTSCTATCSFRKTAILFFQHPSLGKIDEREVLDFQIKQKKLKKLPSYYTDIKPVTLNKTITIEESNALKDTPNDIPSANK